MKKLIFTFIISLFLINCAKQIIKLEEPIKIYIEKDISKKGIEVWDKKVIWVDIKEDPDVMILKTNQLPNPRWDAVQRHIYTWYGKLEKPVYIFLKKPYDVIIAHEFGHLLGYKDDCSDKKSIMCAGYGREHFPLNWFKEFSK